MRIAFLAAALVITAVGPGFCTGADLPVCRPPAICPNFVSAIGAIPAAGGPVTGPIVSNSSITANAFFGDGFHISNVATIDPVTTYITNGLAYNVQGAVGSSAATSKATCPAGLYVLMGGCKCTATLRSGYGTDPEITTGGVGYAPPTSYTCVANAGTCIAEINCSLIQGPNLMP